MRSDSRGEPISTTWQRNRDDADKMLRVHAAYLQFNAVIEIERMTEVQSEGGTSKKGTHRYTAWKASGVPCRID
ncbi:MAG TPA: hypothetical protein VJ044_12400 [Candidatus Hodarchaeales archaeon]|nr:hypothetical protein [Candidatus Hodarchaeales archaeon]